MERLLQQYHIPHARILHYDRHAHFLHGFILEEYLPGTMASQKKFSAEEEHALYRKLAVMVYRVHQIPMPYFGYLCAGDTGVKNILQFLDDNFSDMTETLRKYHLIDATTLSVMRKKLLSRCKPLNRLPAVLCHGDLSTKNIIIDPAGEITLIDWDDAQALCWPFDVARLTLWMKIQYEAQTAAALRESFLQAYRSPDMPLYHACEAALHVWHALDFMNFFAGSPPYNAIEPHLYAAFHSL